MTLLSTLFLSLVLALAPVEQRISPDDRPAPVISNVGLPLPLSSFKELWDKTPVVIRATLRKPLPPHLAEGDLVARLYVFGVDEIFKDDTNALRVSSRVNVLLLGGSLKIAQQEFITSFPILPPEVGTEVILFLEPARRPPGVFTVPQGADGFFPVQELGAKTISINTAASRWPELNGRREIVKSEFVALLNGFRVPH